jgi:hypothetical protein
MTVIEEKLRLATSPSFPSELLRHIAKKKAEEAVLTKVGCSSVSGARVTRAGAGLPEEHAVQHGGRATVQARHRVCCCCCVPFRAHACRIHQVNNPKSAPAAESYHNLGDLYLQKSMVKDAQQVCACGVMWQGVVTGWNSGCRKRWMCASSSLATRIR